MKIKAILGAAVCALGLSTAAAQAPAGYKLVWADEFDTDGPPSSKYWNFERGYQRNHELQWYLPENVTCADGMLIIEARADDRPCPRYRPGSSDWRNQRERITCTSGSINSKGKVFFTYGRLEVRAKIPTASGSWPAIWLAGEEFPWPSCGEIDVMEYYLIDKKPYILANACWGSDIPHKGLWDMGRVPFKNFTKKDRRWADKFHVWTMDWTPEYIRIYLDNELINEIELSKTINGSAVPAAAGKNPFHMPQYLLLNLAIEGDNGGKPDWKKFPLRYEIDYVRIYQKDDSAPAAQPSQPEQRNKGWQLDENGEIHF